MSVWFTLADCWLTHTGTRWTLSCCLWAMGTRASLWTPTVNSDGRAHGCRPGETTPSAGTWKRAEQRSPKLQRAQTPLRKKQRLIVLIIRLSERDERSH